MVQEGLERLSKVQGNPATEHAITAQCRHSQATPPHKSKDTVDKENFFHGKRERSALSTEAELT